MRRKAQPEKQRLDGGAGAQNARVTALLSD